MSPLSSDLQIRLVDATCEWSAARVWPEILGFVPTDARAQVLALDQSVPTLRSIAPVDAGAIIRPPSHRRAFYLRGAHGGVLAFKGTEPLALDFAQFVAELADARVAVELRLGNPLVDRTLTRAQLSALEKFPLLEGKVPGCVTVGEAHADAAAALAVQRAYVAKHGRVARLPLPLFVGRWSDDVGERVLAALHGKLTGRAWDDTVARVRAGLGVYVYAYPTLPTRLVELVLPDVTRKRELKVRRAELDRALDPARVFHGWLGLVAELLVLGFVPKAPASVLTGDCLQVQNLVLDGGLADAESLISTAALSERALRDALRKTVHELAIAATRLLVGLWSSTVDFRDRVPDLVVVVWNALAVQVAAADAVDPRVLAILRPTQAPLDAIAQILRETL